MFVSALSGVTSRTGLTAAVPAAFHDPFNLALLLRRRRSCERRAGRATVPATAFQEET
jgi:hypothetical protein